VAAEGSGGEPEVAPLARESFPLARAHRPLNLLRWRLRLGRLLESEQPDVLLCGNLRPLGPVCRDLARRHRIPWYFFVHGNDLLAAHRRWSGFRRSLWRSVTGSAAGWLANSQAVKSLGVFCGLNPARGFVLPPEVDDSRFRPASESEQAAARRSFGLPAGETLILFIGRLVARKGLDRLIAALPALAREELAPWRLVVAGFGDAAPFEQAARASDLAERVVFLGAVPEARLPLLYSSGDLLAMPSRTIAGRDDLEGFGIVYLEAAASGLPALAGRSGGAPEAVLHEVTGLVVDGEDHRAIAGALRMLIGDPALRRRLGHQGRERAVLEFGRGTLAGRLMTRLRSDRAATGLNAGS
jgi:phosphatidylinositol alpha-1,6-mannosyltransferase